MNKNLSVLAIVMFLVALAASLAAAKVGHGGGTYGFFSGA